MPEALLESELFGHVAGAFTSAVGDKIGKFKLADGGTMFLDEISTASPAMQVKLLRVLQDFEFEQVGGTKTFHVDTRVILATNDRLEDLVRDGRFRQDLYYRINVINIELPPLRDRVSDIPLLAAHFLKDVCEECNKEVAGFTDECMAALEHYHWPGNVRELANVIERAVLLGKGGPIGVEDLPAVTMSGGGRASNRWRAAPSRKRSKSLSGGSSWKCWKATSGTATPRPTPWASTARRFTRR